MFFKSKPKDLSALEAKLASKIEENPVIENASEPHSKANEDSAVVNEPYSKAHEDSTPKADTLKKDSFHDGLRVINHSLEWYKDKFRSTVKIATYSVVTNILLILVLIGLLVTRPTPVYFGLTPDLRVIELPATSEPYIQNAGLTTWAAQAVASTFALSFRNWKDQLNSVKSLYDPKAFTSLVLAMDSNGILPLIKDKRLVCSAVIQDAPVIHSSGVQNGVYVWRVKMPVLISYESSKGVEVRQTLEADLLIQRASTLEYPSGINIKQIILTNKV